MSHATCRALRPLVFTLIGAAVTASGAAKSSRADPESGSTRTEVKAEAKTAPAVSPASGTAQTTSGKIPVDTVKTPPPPPPPGTGTHAATPPAQPQYRPPVEENNWMETHGQVPHFDLGASWGYNNPAGMLGLEGEYRLYDFLGVGFEGGLGLWGLRFSPVVHGYPFGASNLGLFGELAFSLNTGGHTTSGEGASAIGIDMGWAPALSAAVGLRRQWLTYFWTTVKLGYQWNMAGADGFTITGGGTPSADLIKGMQFFKPGDGMFGGWVFGMSAGIAIL